MKMFKRFARDAPVENTPRVTPRLIATSVCLGLLLSAVTLWLTVGRNQPSTTDVLWNDLLWYFMPLFSALNRALSQGVFPLWNPSQLAGLPFLGAFQTQTLYPPAWAVAWLPPHLAVSAYAVLHWTLALVGTTWLAAELRIRPLAALTAAVAYCLSAPVTMAFFFHSASLAVDAWLPLCLAATLRLVAPGASWKRLAPLAASLSLALLAGAPEQFSYLCFGVALMAAWRGAVTGALSGAARALVRVAVALAMVAPLAAMQLLPTFELSQLAIRSFDTFDFAYITRYSQSWGSLLSALALGHEGPGRLSMLAIPLGLLALLLPGRRREAIGLTALCLLLLDLLRGANGYVFPLYYEWVPLSRAFRIHLRAELLFSVFAALLLGLGADAVARWLSRRAAAARWLPALLLVAVAGEGLWHGVATKTFVPLQRADAVYGQPQLADVVDLISGPQRVFAVYGEPGDGLQHNFGEMQGLYNIGGYDALVPAKYGPFFDIPEGVVWMGRLRFSARDKSVGAKSFHLPGVRSRSLDLASVRYYLGAGDEDHGAALSALVGGVPMYSGGGYSVAERDRAVPRAYLVHETVLVDSDEAALRAVRDPNFDPSTTVVLRSDSAPALAPASGGESVLITKLSSNSVELDASCTSACLMVLTDLDFPGWIAEVDDDAATILNANYLFRGLALTAGDHRVVFRYRPWSVALGALISALAWLGLGLVYAGGSLKRVLSRRLRPT